MACGSVLSTRYRLLSYSPNLPLFHPSSAPSASLPASSRLAFFAIPAFTYPAKPHFPCRASPNGSRNLRNGVRFYFPRCVARLPAPPAPSALHNDLACSIAVMAGAAALIQMLDFLVKHDFMERKLSRKLIHISTGISFVLSWPIFSTSPVSRFCAVVVPLVNIARLLIYGLGLLKDQGLVNSISREGNHKELLKGPLCYVLVLSFCTVLFWRESPVGMIALALMCGGDGAADIVGRKFGSLKLPYNCGKSWAGSLAMFLFGFCVSLGFMYYYSLLGFFSLDWQRMIFSVAFISLAATVVESLPIASKIDDNLSVPLTAVILGQILLSGATM